MVAPVQPHAITHRAQVSATLAAVAPSIVQPTVSSQIDIDGSGQYGLYSLNDGRFAVAAAGLASGADLPAGGVALMAGEKAWSAGKAVPAALIADADGFHVILKTGEGSKAKFSQQNFDTAGLAVGKPVGLNLATALDTEVTAGQDLNGDNAVGDVIAKVVDASDDAQDIGLYVLTSGRVIIDNDGQATGSLRTAQSVTLTKGGKNWTPGKMQALAVRSTDTGYEVLLKSGSGAKAAYLYQAFDADGKMVSKAQKASADVLLDRELLYGQDLNSDGLRGNVVKTVVDPTAPIEKNLAATSSYARSKTANGEVFLGGKFIELGISGWGSFGTEGAKPSGFYGAPGMNGIGMSADHDGYGGGNNLAIDYFLPGSPEERFAVGYVANGTTLTNSNSARNGAKNMATVVENTSVGRTLSAKVTSTWEANGASVMTIKQEVSFDAESMWFKNRVTITNETDSNWTGARYMRSFDPDNTVAQGGVYKTRNTVIGTIADDGFSAVKAETFDNSDPLYTAFNSRSPIMFFSMGSGTVASTFGFANSNPYDQAAYASPKARNQPEDRDQAITLDWDSGALSAGESKAFDYYTSLDNRVADAIISEIYGVGLYQMQSGSYAVAKAPATAGDLVDNRVTLKEKGKAWAPKGGAPISVRQSVDGYEVTFKSGTGAKAKYFLQKFDATGNATGKAEKLTTAKLVGLETPFEQDVNSDTYLGNKISGVIDASDTGGQNGLYKMAAGGVWISKNDLTEGANLAAGAVQLTAKGKPWSSAKETPLALRVNNDGLYELVTRTGIGLAAKLTRYNIDQTGAFVGKGAAIKSNQIAEQETNFNQDLNGNGAIGS